MQRNDYQKFLQALTAVAEVYGKEMSEAAITMWWKLLEQYDIERVTKALYLCVSNPDYGHFMPKPADVIRAIQGTTTDRASIAWGKVLSAMSEVGAYQAVVFDDPAIHAAIEDCGGWSKLCRTESKELGFVQHRFCGSHKAYTTKGQFDYPRVMLGDRDPDSAYAAKGLDAPRPAFVGMPADCEKVMAGGSASGKGAITFKTHLEKLASNHSQIARPA
jgi:hypothetical protein